MMQSTKLFGGQHPNQHDIYEHQSAHAVCMTKPPRDPLFNPLRTGDPLVRHRILAFIYDNDIYYQETLSQEWFSERS